MSVGLPPWWQDVHHAAQLVASTLDAAASKAGQDGSYTAPPGSTPPRRRRKPASLRHLAEVIRTNKWCPGVGVDKDVVAAVLAGDLRYIVDPVLVVAVARACHDIAGNPFTDEDASALTVAVERINWLSAQAHSRDEQAKDAVPVPLARQPVTPQETSSAAEPVVIDAYFTTRRPRSRGTVVATAIGATALLITVGAVAVLRPWDRSTSAATDTSASATTAPTGPPAETECSQGTKGEDILDTIKVFKDEEATRITPTLDFDAMNGSARYQRYNGRTYYWGRAGSDDNDPHAGGARLRWRTAAGPWHSCAAKLPVNERGYVHTPAVATTIDGQAVTIQVCLWRDTPYRENCTIPI